MGKRYSKEDIKKYEDGWWITFVDTFQNKRIKSIGPFKQKAFAENEMEALNRNYTMKT